MNEKAFTAAELGTLIRGIVYHLPGATLVFDEGRPHSATFADERKVYFRYDCFKHRLSVGGCWPKSRLPGDEHNYSTRKTPRDVLAYQEANPYKEISVDASKSAEKIAEEITRRFLPGYNAIFARCVAARNRHENYVLTEKDFRKTLAAALECSETNLTLPQNLKDGDSYGTVEVQGNHAEFRIRYLEADRALKLVEFLKTL